MRNTLSCNIFLIKKIQTVANKTKQKLFCELTCTLQTCWYTTQALERISVRHLSQFKRAYPVRHVSLIQPGFPMHHTKLITPSFPLLFRSLFTPAFPMRSIRLITLILFKCIEILIKSECHLRHISLRIQGITTTHIGPITSPANK